MKIGRIIQQTAGYKVFFPGKFPPAQLIGLNAKSQQLHARAVLMLGKLDGIAIIAEAAIITSKKINTMRQNDIVTIHTLGRRAKTAMLVLDHLYRLPMVSVRKIEEWTGLSRPQANEPVKKLVEIGILEQKDKEVKYGREFWYRSTWGCL